MEEKKKRMIVLPPLLWYNTKKGGGILLEKRRRISSPLGSLLLIEEAGRLVALLFDETEYCDETPLLLAAERELSEYFEKKRLYFDLPLLFAGSAFMSSVLRALEHVPYGKTLTYGELAALAGYPRAARAVGNVLNKNPLPILVPCHRVVAAAGEGNYAWGMEKKRFLLSLEGGRA